MSKAVAQPNVKSPPTIDQRRARHAWAAVISLAATRDGQRQYDGKANEFAREAKKLPMRVMAAGLGSALSFLLAKAKPLSFTTLGRPSGQSSAWTL